MNTQSIIDNLTAVGLNVSRRPLVIDGRWHKVPMLDGKNTKLPCGYIINTAINIVSWINFKTGEKGGFPIDKSINQNKTDYKYIMAQQRREEANRFFENARVIATQYNSMPSCNAQSDYLQRKQVKNFGCKVDERGNLLIPIRSLSIKDNRRVSYIRSMQTIYPNGNKILAKGCEKSGNMHMIGFNNNNLNNILITEGYATAASLHMATGLPVIMAVDANNIYKVTEKVKKIFSGSKIIICADNDKKTELKIGKNPGVDSAMLCKERLGVDVIVPNFDKLPNALDLTDFNDLHCACGLESVRNELKQYLMFVN